jgi:hypothetical protein
VSIEMNTTAMTPKRLMYWSVRRGLIFAALFVVATVRLRRYREPI